MSERVINPDHSPKSPFNLGSTLVALRRFNGFSQPQVARLAEISQGYLVNLENNDAKKPKNPGVEKLIGLSRVFGVGLHFWEGLADHRVFLTHQARLAQELRQNPQAKKIIDELSRKLPFTENPARYYIDQLPQHDPLLTIYFERKESLGFNQKDIKRKSELSQSHLSQFEQGEIANPSLRSVAKLSKALQISEYTLLGLSRIWPHYLVANFDNFFRNQNIDSETRFAVYRILKSLKEYFGSITPEKPVSPILTTFSEPTPPPQP